MDELNEKQFSLMDLAAVAQDASDTFLTAVVASGIDDEKLGYLTEIISEFCGFLGLVAAESIKAGGAAAASGADEIDPSTIRELLSQHLQEN